MKITFLMFSYYHNGKPNMPVMLHTLLFAREMKESGNEVKIILEGEGVLWGRDLLKEDHPLSNHLKLLLGDIVVCEACANMFNVIEDVKNKLTLEKDLHGHVSLKKYLDQGYKVISL